MILTIWAIFSTLGFLTMFVANVMSWNKDYEIARLQHENEQLKRIRDEWLSAKRSQ
jgi:hypothetical protein